MGLKSIKNILAEAGLANVEQFADWAKAWRTAVESGSQESLLGFFSREAGISEDVFLQKLATTLGWPYLDLPHISITADAQKRVSTKVAFQYGVLPTKFENERLQVAVSNPFDTSLLNAIQFDAQCAVEFGLAPKAEIEKALKKYYGVGAETLNEIAEDEPLDLVVDKEITEGDQEASVIKFVNQVIWEAFKDRAT